MPNNQIYQQKHEHIPPRSQTAWIGWIRPTKNDDETPEERNNTNARTSSRMLSVSCTIRTLLTHIHAQTKRTPIKHSFSWNFQNTTPVHVRAHTHAHTNNMRLCVCFVCSHTQKPSSSRTNLRGRVAGVFLACILTHEHAHINAYRDYAARQLQNNNSPNENKKTRTGNAHKNKQRAFQTRAIT